MVVSAFVLSGRGRDKNGEFDYGGYEVALHDCACGAVYSDQAQHADTAGHKAWKLTRP